MAAIFQTMFSNVFLDESVWISIKITLKFVPKDPINNTPTLFLIMAWHRPGYKLLSDTTLVSLLTHICVTRLQWVKIQNMIIYKIHEKYEIKSGFLYFKLMWHWHVVNSSVWLPKRYVLYFIIFTPSPPRGFAHDTNQRSISLTIFRQNSHSMEISFCSFQNSKKMIVQNYDTVLFCRVMCRIW